MNEDSLICNAVTLHREHAKLHKYKTVTCPRKHGFYRWFVRTVAPVAPAAPIDPGAPVGPVAPTNPLDPVGPVGPATTAGLTTWAVGLTGCRSPLCVQVSLAEEMESKEVVVV